MPRSTAARRARRGPIRPAKPLTAAQARTLADASPQTVRVLRMIVAHRLLRGQGPRPAEVWAMFHHGHPARWPRRGRFMADGTEESESVVTLLDWLRQYGVTFDTDLPGSIGMTRPFYNALRPSVIAELAAAGEWPPRIRYRGPRQGAS